MYSSARITIPERWVSKNTISTTNNTSGEPILSDSRASGISDESSLISGNKLSEVVNRDKFIAASIHRNPIVHGEYTVISMTSDGFVSRHTCKRSLTTSFFSSLKVASARAAGTTLSSSPYSVADTNTSTGSSGTGSGNDHDSTYVAYTDVKEANRWDMLLSANTHSKLLVNSPDDHSMKYSGSQNTTMARQSWLSSITSNDHIYHKHQTDLRISNYSANGLPLWRRHQAALSLSTTTHEIVCDTNESNVVNAVSSTYC